MVANAPRSIDPEELLEHTGWMRVLARGLVDDEATAEDLVQQACTAALERPPRDRAALGGWLARVVRNLAARGLRDSSRRKRRERHVARPEAETPDLGTVVERAELLRLVMDAVLELDEPFRSTVLLRYHEELPPEQVARRLGVSVTTVGTRLHRALAQLRARLDRTRGGRDAWVALLAPWAGLAAAAGAAAATGAATGTASASGLGSGASSSVPAAAVGAAGTATGTSLAAIGTHALFGGIIVMKNSFLASAIAGAICAAVGYGIGRTSAPPAEPHEGEIIVAEAEYTALVDQDRTWKETARELRAQRDALLKEKDTLVSRAERAENSLAAAEAETVPEMAAAAVRSSSLVVAFGEWGNLPEIRDADWTALGETVTAINNIVTPLIDDIAAGRPVSASSQIDVQVENQKLVRYAVSLIDKIPSNAPMPVNGEFTHPINLINFIAAMLENAGLPLSERQRTQIAAIGNSYDSEYAAVNATYGESTWELTKILDELSLKRDTMLEVENRLTADQLEIVAIPKIQNRVRLDTLSPVNMVIMNIQAMLVDERSKVQSRIRTGLVENLGVPSELLDGNTDLLARYEQDLDSILAPVQRETAEFLHLDDILVAGRAQERLLADLVARETLTEELLASIGSLQAWAIPQVVATAETP